MRQFVSEWAIPILGIVILYFAARPKNTPARQRQENASEEKEE